jgi:hypothetical protein
LQAFETMMLPEISSSRTSIYDRAARLERALERHATTCGRLARLERLLANPLIVDRLLRQNRYLRLVAAIAWASEKAEAARTYLEISRRAVAEPVPLH